MQCPVCGNDTFDEEDFEYEICPECFWEYDVVQVKYPEFTGGANHHCLLDYKKFFIKQKEIKEQFSCRNEEDKQVMLDFELAK